jgi:hypothetical protein
VIGTKKEKWRIRPSPEERIAFEVSMEQQVFYSIWVIMRKSTGKTRDEIFGKLGNPVTSAVVNRLRAGIDAVITETVRTLALAAARMDP